MKFLNPSKTFSPQELILLGVFIIYLVFPIQTPSFLNGIIDSSLGVTTIFVITLGLFLYAHPVLAILYLFVAYELLRRSSVKHIVRSNKVFRNNENVPTLNEIDLQDREVGIQSIVHSEDTTLEEEVVQKMGPIGQSDPVSYLNSSFKPFADNVKGASSVYA